MDSAIREVGRISDAVAGATGMMAIGADTSGLDDAHGAVSSLRGHIQGLSQDLSGLSGMGLDLGGGGGLRDLAGDLSGFSGALGSAASGIGDFNEAGSTFGRTSSDFSRSGAEMRQEIESITGATDGLTASTRELVSVQSDGAQVMNAVRAGSTPGGSFGGSGGGSFGGSGGLGGSGGSGGGPPGGSGPGGIGGDDDDAFGGRGGLHSLAQPLMMGTMLGGAESVVTGAAGFMAVEEAIKSNPALKAAQKNAIDGLKGGIEQASWSGVGDALAGMAQLGPTLRNLGLEAGTIAAEHMATALSGANSMATTATQTMKALDPAIESNMTGLTGLANAVMNGIANPSTVTAIKGVGDALTNPENEAGITSLVSGLGTVGATVATVAADAAGLAGNVLGMSGDEAEGPLLSSALGGYVGKKALGGKTLGGKLSAGLAGAGIFGMAALDAEQGIDPTPGVVGGAGGFGLARLLGGTGPMGLAAAAGGEILAHNPELLAGGAFTTPGADTQGPGGGLTERLPSMAGGLWDQATSGQGISGLWDNATSTVKNLWNSGGKSTRDDLTPNAPWSPKPAPPPVDETKKLMDSFLAFVGAGGSPAAFGSLDGGAGSGGQPIIGAQGAGTWTTGSGIPGVPAVSGGGASPVVGASGGGTWTTSSGGGGGGGPVMIPKGPGSSGSFMSAADLAGLGLGPSARAGGAGGGGDVPPGFGTPGGSNALGGADPHPTGGWSTDNRVTLSSGWDHGAFQSGAPGGPAQILSSLTDLRSTASNMFGAMGGLPGGGQPAAALRRDWAATRGMEGASQEQYGDASRYLGSDIQRGSAAIWAGGQAAVDAYTDRLADQNHLVRAPATGVSSDAVGGQSLTGQPLYPGIGANADNNAPMSNLGTQLSALGGRPGVPGAVTDTRSTAGSPAAAVAGQEPGGARPGGVGMPGFRPGNQAAEVAGREPGGAFRGLPLGPGSSGPAGAGQLQHLNEMMGQTQSHSQQLNQSNSQLGQSLHQVAQSGQTAAQSLGQDHQQAQSLQSGMQSISSGAGHATSALGELGKTADSATGSTQGLGAAANSAIGDTGLSGFVQSIGTGASNAANVSGQAISQSLAQGITQGGGSVNTAAGELGHGATNAAASALKTHSPSQEFNDLGMSTGQGMTIGINSSMPAVAAAVGGGIHGITDAARGVASDAGLMVGFSYVESIETGVEQAVKTSEFQQMGFADIKSAAAKTALGILGLMGPAGSGAQSYQLSAQEVSFARGTAANPPAPQTIVIQPQPVLLDGQVIATVADRRISVAFGQLTDSYSRQRSG